MRRSQSPQGRAGPGAKPLGGVVGSPVSRSPASLSPLPDVWGPGAPPGCSGGESLPPGEHLHLPVSSLSGLLPAPAFSLQSTAPASFVEVHTP